MSLTKDYTAEDLQNAFDKGRVTGRGDVYDNIAELDQENRLLRARCERLQGELDTAEQAVQDLKDQLTVERMSHKDMANVLNNYEELIRDLTDALRAAGGKTHGA